MVLLVVQLDFEHFVEPKARYLLLKYSHYFRLNLEFQYCKKVIFSTNLKRKKKKRESLSEFTTGHDLN